MSGFALKISTFISLIFATSLHLSAAEKYGTLWGMRGISNDRNTKLIYLTNGHKMNTQARDGFKGEVVLGLLNDSKQIEVLRGPAGVIYGSGAIAGIINVVTKKTTTNQRMST